MTSAYYSTIIGLDENYLNVYRAMRGYPKGTDKYVLFEAYNKEIEYEKRLTEELQNMYYDLLDRSCISALGRLLVQKKVYSKVNSIHIMLGKQFKGVEKLRGKIWVNRVESILKIYNENKESLQSGY